MIRFGLTDFAMTNIPRCMENGINILDGVFFVYFPQPEVLW